MAKIQPKKIYQKPLTLDDLVRYNQEVLFPALDDKFAKIDGEIKEKFDKVLTGQDKILKSIEDLSSENTADIELHKKQEEKLENHEARIKIVERKVGIEAVK